MQKNEINKKARLQCHKAPSRPQHLQHVMQVRACRDTQKCTFVPYVCHALDILNFEEYLQF